MRASLLLLGIAAVLVTAAPAAAANRPDPSDPLWPCVQRKVPEISLGAVWSGPEIDPANMAWKEDPEVRQLVRALVQRRVTLEEADAMVLSFAEKAGEQRSERLLLLFSGLFDTLNRERKDVMSGITRFAKKQIDFSDMIKAANQDLARMQAEKAEFSAIQAKNDEVLMEIRVFDERQKSLTYVCEVPVLIEQRLFHLGRTIAGAL